MTLEEYHAAIAEVTILIEQDPEPDSPKSLQLKKLVDEIAEYENEKFPI